MIEHSTFENDEQLEALSPLAWVINNNFVNENGETIEFFNHRYLIKIYNDMHPDQVAMKSAQVGFSVAAIIKAKHILKNMGMNIIYTLPTQNVVKDFVIPKVDPLILQNKAISDTVSKDSVSLKQVGDRFIYYRGSFSEREAIAISADILINDEYDRSDQKILNVYQSRLQHSKWGWQWRFSNPTVPGFGVHYLYQNSDQMHWFVTCEHCGHESYMNFEYLDEYQTHFVDRKRIIYACGKCNKEITDEARRTGRWVAKYPDNPRRGYWISQLMATWVKAKYVVEKYDDSTPEFFHNFVLGLPYVAADILVDRESIIKGCSPGTVYMNDVVMGIDNGILKHWVLGTPTGGIFKYGKTENWDEIEGILRQYDVQSCVIDANPYPTVPKKLVKKYKGRVFINYYNLDRKDLSVTSWETGDKYGVVRSDRTGIIDRVANEINTQTIIFTMRPQDVEEYITHWTNMYRTIETNNQGIDKGLWVTKEGKPDHYAHATIYWRLAIEKLGKGLFSGGVKPLKPNQPLAAPTVNEGRVEGVDLDEAIKNQKRKKQSWKSI